MPGSKNSSIGTEDYPEEKRKLLRLIIY